MPLCDLNIDKPVPLIDVSDLGAVEKPLHVLDQGGTDSRPDVWVGIEIALSTLMEFVKLEYARSAGMPLAYPFHRVKCLT